MIRPRHQSFNTQVSLVPPPCEEFTTSDPFFSATRVSPPGVMSIPSGEKGRLVPELVWARPTAEFNGISGGYEGDGFKTVIAAQASAKVSFRLVHKQDPAAIRAAFRKFVEERIPADCSVSFKKHGGSPAIQLAYDSPIVTKAAPIDPSGYVDPVPQALVLTAIVISFATTALFLVVLLASRGFTGTDHVDGKEPGE